MIDLHCHLLPGIDDGPESEADAVQLARALVAAGVTCVAATPHVGWDWPAEPDEIPTRTAAFVAVLAAHEIPLEVVAAAEIQATVALELSDEQLRALALGAGRRLLIEPPMGRSIIGIDRVLVELRMRGHEILLAHPERCLGFQRDVRLLERLVADGALTQVTAGALSGRFGGVVAGFARDLVGCGLVHSVASDAHGVLRRPPGMRAELERVGLEGYRDWWCRLVPAAILEGGPIPEAPEPWPPPAPPGRGPALRGIFRRR